MYFEQPPPPRAPQFSILHAAAITGDKSGVSRLCAAQIVDVDARDKFGRTPLMFAALADFAECAEALLKHGARPQLRDRSGRTAMHWAAHHGHVGCLKAIYGRGKQQAGGEFLS